MKEHYTKEEYELAQSQNLVSYLMSAGYELKPEGGNYYRSKEHSSLVINENGKWFWNSKNLSGNRPVELVKQLLMIDDRYDEKTAYLTAIKRLAGTEGEISHNDLKSLKPKIIENKQGSAESENKGNILLPPKNKDNRRVVAYLCKTRKLDPEIVFKLMAQGKIYETEKYHNACFVCYDKNNVPRHAFIRKTNSYENTKEKSEQSPSKFDVKNSDKSYGLSLAGRENANKVYCFENHIDALSHATLYKMNGLDYKDGHRITLHGTSFKALEKFLEENPQITEIISCLDRDTVGLNRGEKMCKEYYEKGYRTFIQPPRANDYNEQLVKFVAEKETVKHEILRGVER